MTKLMIYGATGYTGRIAAEHAEKAGTLLVLAGRNEATLSTLSLRVTTHWYHSQVALHS